MKQRNLFHPYFFLLLYSLDSMSLQFQVTRYNFEFIEKEKKRVELLYFRFLLTYSS